MPDTGLLYPLFPLLWWWFWASSREPSTLFVARVSFPCHHFAQQPLWSLLCTLLDCGLALPSPRGEKVVFSTSGGMNNFSPQHSQPDRRVGLTGFSSQEAEFHPCLILCFLSIIFFKGHIPIYSSMCLKILFPDRFLPSYFIAKAAWRVVSDPLHKLFVSKGQQVTFDIWSWRCWGQNSGLVDGSPGH